MSEQSKLLAYFGSDLALRNSARYLGKAHSSGYALLALDSHAMALATRADVPYTLLDDWLDPETIVNALRVARVCGREWFESARNEFSVDGICLPQIDTLAMESFWQDAVLATELAGAVRERRISEFRFFGNLFPRSAVSHSASDVCSRIWRAELPDNYSCSLILDAFKPGSVLSVPQRLIGRLKNAGSAESKTSDPQSTPFPRGSVVLVFHCDEDLRFSHVVADLAERFPGKVAGVMGSHRGEKPAPVFPTWGVPVAFGPHWPITSWLAVFPSLLLPRVDAALEQRFLAGYWKSLHASQGRPWERPLKILKFQFDYYCKYRWPFLYKQDFQYWLRLWETTKPRAVLVTAEPEAVFVLASEAAAQLGIPTLTIPHACGGGRLVWENLFKGRMLHNSVVQGMNLERSGVSKSTLQGCSGLIAKDEYPVHRVKAFSGKGKCRLLALTETTGEGPHLTTYTSLSAQLTALRALVGPPPDLKDRIDVAVKVHPFISDLPMLEAAGPAVLQRLMPRASELESALKETDLVVGVNYRGGAIVHALRMAMPIIYFLTENEAMLRRPDYPYDTFQEGTVVARNAEDFWNLVRRFLVDPDFVKDLRSRSASFARDNLSDEQYPGLAELVENLAPSEPPERLLDLASRGSA